MTVWQAGMRCVCIRQFEPRVGLEDACLPVKGSVYTVRAVVNGAATGAPGLYLCEIDNAHLIRRPVIYLDQTLGYLHAELAFDADHFKPLSERRIDQFRALLAPTDRVPA